MEIEVEFNVPTSQIVPKHLRLSSIPSSTTIPLLPDHLGPFSISKGVIINATCNLYFRNPDYSRDGSRGARV